MDESTMVFVPTHEWQKVEEGQMIPPGLHVKMDMTSGGKWAKLMEEKSGRKEENKLQVVPVDDKDGSTHMSGHSITELKRALKNIKAESTTTDQQGAVKGKFKSMDEIRSALGDLEVKQESDVQVMLRLLGVIRGYEGSPEVAGSQGHLELVTALQDIEYYIHQIDNANDFVKIGGFPDVIKLLNHSMAEVREESIHLIGSAAQSNPPVQVELMGLNVMPMLLRQVSDPGETPGVRKKCLFALSSMIRHFPLAQTKFGEIGGFPALRDLFKQEETASFRMKAIRLVGDLTLERLTTERDSDKMKQYDRFPLFMKLRELRWCHLVVECLRSTSHEDREISMNALNSLKPACSSDFQTDGTDGTLEVLRRLQLEYASLWDAEVAQGDDDGYFKLLHDLSSNVINNLSNWKPKDEL